MGDDSALLTEATRRLDEAQRLEDVQHIVRTTARRLVHADGATLVLLQGDECYYADEDALSPLWKGQRFPASDCISGWAMLHRQVTVVPDISVDRRIPQEAYRPTFVRSLAIVPIRIGSPLGAIGTYWGYSHEASDPEVGVLTRLAERAGAALERLLPVNTVRPRPRAV
jgi:GAF domain-containing protein